MMPAIFFIAEYMFLRSKTLNSLSFTALIDITYSVYCIARFECIILLQMAHRVTLNQKAAVTAYPASDFNSPQSETSKIKSN